MTAYTVAFVVYWKVLGLPIDPVLIFLFLWAGTIAWNVAAPVRTHLVFARDWAPVMVVILAYSFSRGAADNLGIPLHVTEPIRIDRWLAGGVLPTAWLQQHLYTPSHTRWYDVVASFVYFSHFVTAMIVAAVLWVRGRSVWASFMRRFIALDLLGLVIYVLYPMAPPWWAAERGYLADAPRITNRGWDLLGLHSAGKLVTRGQAVANPVAAMPSLHSAFALLIALFFILQVRRAWTLVLLIYPLAMAWTLIYCAEHYLVDILAGWACTIVVLVAVSAGERWWTRQGARAS